MKVKRKIDVQTFASFFAMGKVINTSTTCDDGILYLQATLVYSCTLMRHMFILYLKVFLKDKLESELEIERNKWLKEVAKVINNRLWSYAVRKRFLRIKAAIVMIQKVYKVSWLDLALFLMCNSKSTKFWKYKTEQRRKYFQKHSTKCLKTKGFGFTHILKATA